MILGTTAEYKMKHTNKERLEVLVAESNNRLMILDIEIDQIELELDNKEEKLKEVGLRRHEEREFQQYLLTLLNHNRGNTNAN